MSATKPLVASSSGIGMKIVGDVERLAGDAREVEVVERVDHRRRRVDGAEELHLAALVPRALRQRQVAGARPARTCRSADRTIVPSPPTGAERGAVRDRANQVDQVVVRNELELLPAIGWPLAVERHEVASAGERRAQRRVDVIHGDQAWCWPGRRRRSRPGTSAACSALNWRSAVPAVALIEKFMNCVAPVSLVVTATTYGVLRDRDRLRRSSYCRSENVYVSLYRCAGGALVDRERGVEAQRDEVACAEREVGRRVLLRASPASGGNRRSSSSGGRRSTSSAGGTRQVGRRSDGLSGGGADDVGGCHGPSSEHGRGERLERP